MNFKLTSSNKKKLNELKAYFKDYISKNSSNYTLVQFFELFIKSVSKSSETDYNSVLEAHSIEKIGSFVVKELNNKIKEKLFLKNALKARKYTCFAPHTTLNFDKAGNISACCSSRSYNLGTYPDDSIKNIWFGEKLNKMREELANLNFSQGCNSCSKQITSGNFANSLLKKFDFYSAYVDSYPSVFEFEISNTCNYECIMCGGYYSSSIRKNREKLPFLSNVYDNNFVDQLKEFIPHLKVCNFLGGEPFLTPVYYKIWDAIKELNSTIKIYVTTNGSILNKKVREAVLGLPNFKLVFSIDSLNHKTYSFIRRNGDLDKVLETFNFFNTYNRVSTLAFCPMIQNIYELPSIIDFCRTNNLLLYINTVTEPLGGRIVGIHENGTSNTIFNYNKKEEVSNKLDTLIPEVSLYSLPKNEKEAVIKFLSNLEYPLYYKEKIQGIINSLKLQN